MASQKITAKILCVSAFFILGMVAGYWLKAEVFSLPANHNQPLRMGGFKYTSPLLICDSDPTIESKELEPLKEKISQAIDEEKANRDVNAVSVFFRDLKNSNQLDINPDEKYHPASLNKIPLMLAYYWKLRTVPDILDKEIKVELDQDYNAIQEIKPKDTAENGQTYTIEALIEKMIEYSDNNAYEVLLKEIDRDEVLATFNNLHIPFKDLPQNPVDTNEFDYMTADSYSYFLRVLYNASYVRKTESEKALEILTHSDFRDGLAAGLPSNVEIAHKFGQIGFYQAGDNSQIIERQLHDCGIIYYLDNPYLLCVMTKSQGQNSDIEKTLKKISALVYAEFGKSKNN